jgi:hypothetical protein
MNTEEQIYEKVKELNKIVKEGINIPQIDKLNLHNEWVNQPLLYMKYGQALAEASELRDHFKNALERTKASLNINIRKKKEKNKEKVTEGIIEASIVDNEDYHETTRDLELVSGIASKLSTIVKSIDQRKKALEGLVQLYIGEYFSVPREPKSTGGQFEKKKDNELRRKQRKNLNKKKE